jgi:antitoxin Phd
MAEARDRLPGLKQPPNSLAESPIGIGDSIAITATEAQNEFGRVLEHAIRDEVVVITRHNVPRAVLLSVERYRDLTSIQSSVLNTLTDEFDAMLARMQTPDVHTATRRGFNATPEAMGEAAVEAAAKNAPRTSRRTRKAG